MDLYRRYIVYIPLRDPQSSANFVIVIMVSKYDMSFHNF